MPTIMPTTPLFDPPASWRLSSDLVSFITLSLTHTMSVCSHSYCRIFSTTGLSQITRITSRSPRTSGSTNESSSLCAHLHDGCFQQKLVVVDGKLSFDFNNNNNLVPAATTTTTTAKSTATPLYLESFRSCSSGLGFAVLGTAGHECTRRCACSIGIFASFTGPRTYSICSRPGGD